MVGRRMKFAETPISTQQTVYLKDKLMKRLKVKPGEDNLEWHCIEATAALQLREYIRKWTTELEIKEGEDIWIVVKKKGE